MTLIAVSETDPDLTFTLEKEFRVPPDADPAFSRSEPSPLAGQGEDDPPVAAVGVETGGRAPGA